MDAQFNTMLKMKAKENPIMSASKRTGSTWKRWALIPSLVLLIGFLLTTCSDTKKWHEEVQLLNGRIITVTQQRRYDSVSDSSQSGSIPREFWLTLKLAETDNKETTWHEKV
jgi:hypothetical protein